MTLYQWSMNQTTSDVFPPSTTVKLAVAAILCSQEGGGSERPWPQEVSTCAHVVRGSCWALGFSRPHSWYFGMFWGDTIRSGGLWNIIQQMGFSELVCPFPHPTFCWSYLGSVSFLSPVLLFKRKLVLHFYWQVMLKFFLLTHVIKMHYYKFLLVRLVNAVCILI